MPHTAVPQLICTLGPFRFSVNLLHCIQNYLSDEHKSVIIDGDKSNRNSTTRRPPISCHMLVEFKVISVSKKLVINRILI